MLARYVVSGETFEFNLILQQCLPVPVNSHVISMIGLLTRSQVPFQAWFLLQTLATRARHLTPRVCNILLPNMDSKLLDLLPTG